jgi:hypothetical protein
MAGFHTKTFQVYDDYMTPKKVWEDIKDIIPDEVIWEPFYGDGKSGEFLKELGFQVIHEPSDFFQNNKGDIVVSNPPFSKAEKILQRLKDVNKPFILILPCSKLVTQYFRKIFKDDPEMKIIIPRRRIHFTKMIDGVTYETNKCNFDCFYYCWRIPTLQNQLNWLD